MPFYSWKAKQPWFVRNRFSFPTVLFTITDNVRDCVGVTMKNAIFRDAAIKLKIGTKRPNTLRNPKKDNGSHLVACLFVSFDGYCHFYCYFNSRRPINVQDNRVSP